MHEVQNKLDRRRFLARKLGAVLAIALGSRSIVTHAASHARRTTNLTVQLRCVGVEDTSMTIWSQRQTVTMLVRGLERIRLKPQSGLMLFRFQSDELDYSDDYRLLVRGSSIHYHFHTLPGQNLDGGQLFLDLCECDW